MPIGNLINDAALSNAQRAAVTDPVSKNLLQYIPVANDSTGLRAIGSELAPVTIDQATGDLRQNLARAADKFGRHRRAAVCQGLQAGQVELLELRKLGEQIDHRRHQHGAAHALA